MPRRTKIVATLGPSSSNEKTITNMTAQHADIVRINFSHGSAESQAALFTAVRSAMQENNREIAILADMQGPKIRISSFEEGAVALELGQLFTLDPSILPGAGNASGVGIDYPELSADVKPGDTLLLGDGEMQLEVQSIQQDAIVCKNLVSGVLSDHKGINLQGGGLSAGAITEKDQVDIEHAVRLGADFIALSFVRSVEDITHCRALVKKAGGDAAIIAKIERVEALADIDAIIQASDGIMVARGDLAVEIGAAEVPGVQKNLIKSARSQEKPVIIATQMMESMVTSPVPTRAEVSDVANAVLDGADAVMLSAETAVGKYPEKVVETVAHVCLSAEKHSNKHIGSPQSLTLSSVEQAVAVSSMHIANHLDIAGIIALTESGKTPLWMSRIRSGIPIYGLSRHASVRRKMLLYRDVYPMAFDVTSIPYGLVNDRAVALLKAHDLVQDKDILVLTKGDYMGGTEGANAIKILTVGSVYKMKG